MIYSNVPNPPSKFTATMWGKTVTIELDHSDIDLNELMDIFKGLTMASGFEISSWNNVIKDTASEIYNEEHEIVKEALDTTEDDECNECDDNDFFGSWGSVEEEEPISQLQYNLNRDTMAEEESNIDAEAEMRKYAEEEMEKAAERRMDIIGQNGNEGTHYDEDINVWGDEDELETPTDDYKGIYVSKPTFDWDNETNDILTNINDSITLIKDRMEDIDMRMDNIDEQLDILNADVANIEFNIQHPIKEALLNAKVVYDKSVIETERFNKVKEAAMRYSDEMKAKHVPIKDLDVVDMESGEVTYDEDGGFAIKMNKNKVTKGKIKDLKK